ncbi:lysozyme-like protein [Rhizobium phage RHph_X2_28B]|uniref:lysozyme-like protein n=1 Tax=Rhizobium phage RHph_X2_28B TaxID=2836086 RepID=UPI002329960C|nr:lysozyme-like protein [Rhizobium phage RHph_X2_28B]QWY83534.1 lysozyme-like protein [Rhizobium phage RHph_X2_28B]
MTDKYYVYRPLLKLIGFTEGTTKARGYNETLAYGKFTGGPVELVTMTLDQVDALQTKMLAHPDNKWNSSAVGEYQIVRTTRREIQKQLDIPGSFLFDSDMQDRMACYLLGQAGVDKYLNGRLKESTLINNLAKVWASLPTMSGDGHYEGQNTPITINTIVKVLAQVRERHLEEQPIETVEVAVPVEKPVVPQKIETEVRQKTNILSWFTGFAASLAAFATWLGGLDKQTLFIVLGSSTFLVLVMLLGGEWIIRRIRTIKAELEGQ